MIPYDENEMFAIDCPEVNLNLTNIFPLPFDEVSVPNTHWKLPLLPFMEPPCAHPGDELRGTPEPP